MAGQVQLAASGPQEKYFTLNPDYSYFVESFKKHSNFSTQYVDIEPENQVNFGSKVQFRVPQNNGDLLKTLSVKFTLPPLTNNMIYIESVSCTHRICRSDYSGKVKKESPVTISKYIPNIHTQRNKKH